MKSRQSIVTPLLDLIGQTPMVRLDRISSGKHINLLAKLEYFNPSLSIKDRMVLYIISEAEKTKHLKPGTTIVEASSGNTAASIAMIAAIKGYQVVITMPDSTSDEKVKAARAYGAKVIVCPSHVNLGDSEHYVTKAKHIAAEMPSAFMLNQYDNKLNIEAHYCSTGPEIWQQTEGTITHLVACASTGGTVCGVSKYLKEQNPNIKVIVPDPPGSVYYHYSKTQQIGSVSQSPNHVKRVTKYPIKQVKTCKFTILQKRHNDHFMSINGRF